MKSINTMKVKLKDLLAKIVIQLLYIQLYQQFIADTIITMNQQEDKQITVPDYQTYEDVSLELLYISQNINGSKEELRNSLKGFNDIWFKY